MSMVITSSRQLVLRLVYSCSFTTQLALVSKGYDSVSFADDIRLCRFTLAVSRSNS